MKMNQNSIKLYLLLPILSFACNPATEEPAGLESVFNKINNEVLENSKAYETLKESTEVIGHRLTGSENGAQAEEYTFNKFKEYGFEDVVFDEFEVEAWARGSVSMSIMGGGSSEDVKVVSLGHSPVEAAVELEIVDFGNGLRADYEANPGGATNKIPLVYIGILPNSEEGLKNLHRSEKTALAREFGALGIIIINQVDGGVLLTGTASVTGSLLDIPAVCIGKEDGLALKNRLQTETLMAKIEMTNSSDVIKARNVIATLPGSELPNEKIIVGGHLDSWDLATGAIDNGIGSFAILDMARTFIANELKPKRSVQFIMFMGEEQGLLGSKQLVNKWVESGEIQNVKYMMNIDMTGNPIGFNPGGREEAAEFFRELGGVINAIDTTFQNTFRNAAGLHSDHQPFLLEGIPIISMNSNLDRAIYRCYHSDCDSFDLVNEEHIRNTVRFGTMALYGIANADQLPAAKMDSEATKQFVTDQGLKEKLILGNDWRWD